MSELRQLIERLKHLPGKHNQRMHGRNSGGGGGGGGGASASSGGSSKPSKNDDISYAKQQLDRVDRQISKLEQRRVNGQFPSNEMQAQYRELLSARAEYQDEIRRNTPDSGQAVRPYKPIVEPATSTSQQYEFPRSTRKPETPSGQPRIGSSPYEEVQASLLDRADAEADYARAKRRGDKEGMAEASKRIDEWNEQAILEHAAQSGQKRGSRGQGQIASSGGSSKPNKPDDVVDGVKLTKYDRDVIDATKELTRNGIKPSPNNEQTMEYARSAANDINSAGFLEGSVYGYSLETMEITPDGKLERREYPYIGGVGKYTHTPRQIRRVVNTLRETGRRAHYISNDSVDAIVISGNV